MKDTDIIKIHKWLATPKNIVILSHKNPDGDAVGSSLALYHYLRKKGHQTRVILPNDFPDFFKWMPSWEKVFIYERSIKEKTAMTILQADILFLLDFNTLHRIDEMAPIVAKSNAKKILIDHHEQPDEFDIIYSDTKMPATAQMVYHFITDMGDENLINKTIGSCIYTGIMTDTGSFRYRNTSAKTHQVIAKLLKKGVDNTTIHTQVFDSNSVSKLRILRTALNNLNVLADLNTAYLYLSSAEMKENHYQKGDTEGVVNYALSIKNIILAAIFVEDEDQKLVKISFRSRANFDVNVFARNHFDGGGHLNAAGGKSALSLAETIEKFKLLLPQYATALQEQKL